jgi:hypothetical protein
VTESTFDLWMIVTSLRGRARAVSNAIFPIRRDACSVISRVARASRPFGPSVLVSCLTYFVGRELRNGRQCEESHQTLGVLTHDDEVDARLLAGVGSNLICRQL